MTEIEDAPVEAAARTAAPRNKGEDQPSTLRGATSVLLRKVFRRTSAEIPGDSEGAAAIPEDCRTDPGLVGTGPGEGEPRPRDGRRAGSARTESAVSAGSACADRGGRDSGRDAGAVAEGRGEPDADRADVTVNGPRAGRAAPEPAVPEERQNAVDGAARHGRSPRDSDAERDRGEPTPDGAAAEIPSLGDRLRSLGAPGWTGRDAEWLALVCLHGGVFLRQQYLAFLGRSHPELARRFVQRCGKVAVEERWNAFGQKMCRIADRRLYRELGVEHLRPRRDATPAVALRRLLSLDYVIDHLGAPWLPTDGEKVAMFTAAGVPKDVWPGRVYAGTEVAPVSWTPAPIGEEERPRCRRRDHRTRRSSGSKMVYPVRAGRRPRTWLANSSRRPRRSGCGWRRRDGPSARFLPERVLRVASSSAVGSDTGRCRVHGTGASHRRSRGTYGAPRIHAELTAGGVALSRKWVARVMRSAGIAGGSRRRGPARRGGMFRPGRRRIGLSGASRRPL